MNVYIEVGKWRKGHVGSPKRGPQRVGDEKAKKKKKKKESFLVGFPL